MRRMPLRRRLTLTFAVVMALVVGGFGSFLYVQVRDHLDHALDRELVAVLGELTAMARYEFDDIGKPDEDEIAETGERYVQLLTPEGDPVEVSPGIDGVELADPARIGAVPPQGELVFERPPGDGVEERLRVGLRRVRSGARDLIAVAGVSLEERDGGLAALAFFLALGGPVAVLLASGAGYLLASAALGPVEAMRWRAAAVAPDEPGTRLPVPIPDDELRRLAETLNEMLSRQEAAFERERGFVSDSSHELRTPLAILKAELELALRGDRSHADLLAALRSAAEETDRLSQLAEDLLVISRFDQGRLPVHREPMRVSTVLEDAAERFGPRFDAADRELTVYDSGPLEAPIDRLRLDQAVGNLVDNALRHGGGLVELWVEPDEHFVHIHVADEGPGFPEGFLPAAFDRFTRADAARSAGGTGLGLSIVDAIARAHGGVAAAAVANGGGAEIRVSLPIEPFDAVASPIGSTSEEAPAQA